MTYQVVITETANDDLNDIGEYIEQSSGPLASERFVQHVVDVIQSLDFAPDRTALRQDLRPELHVIHADRYLVFYRIVGRQVVVLRVIHGARDVRTDMFSE